MTRTRDRLRALHAEAGRQHVRFAQRKRRRTAVSRAASAATGLGALATAAASIAGMSTAAMLTLGAGTFIAIAVNLWLTSTQRDLDLHLLRDAWRRHRTDAAQLLARDAVQRPADTAERIQHDTIELERRIAGTRVDSMLVLPPPGPAKRAPEGREGADDNR